MFKGRDNGTGYWMTFDNGIRISVQWSDYHYVDKSKRTDNAVDKYSSPNAEVAAITSEGDWITQFILILLNKDCNHEDDVVGHMTTNEVLEFMNYTAMLTEEDIQRNKVMKLEHYERLRAKYV